MKFIENGQLIDKDQDEKSANCSHEIIVVKNENGDNRRYCKHCGMVAHEDGSFAYCCWMDWCRCME